MLFALLGDLISPFSFVRKKWPPGSGHFFLPGSLMQPRALPPVNISSQALMRTSWTFPDADETPQSPGVQESLSLFILISLSHIHLTHHTMETAFTQDNGLSKWESHSFPRPAENMKRALDHRHSSFLLSILSIPTTSFSLQTVIETSVNR